MKIIFALIVIAAFLFLGRFLDSYIERMGKSKSVNPYRVKYVARCLKLSLGLICLILLFLVWGIEYAQVSVFLSSVFAVIGVALFAQWSMLSNITASMIIFFACPYRVGDKIKVADKDYEVEGVIDQITLFHVIVKRDDELVTYPNNLLLQKAVILTGKAAVKPEQLESD